MKPLDKPYKGVSVMIFGVLFHLNWSKSLLWGDNTDRGTRHTHYFSVFTARRGASASALTIIIGPIKIMIGVL